MEVQDAIDLGREAIWTALLIGSPVLLSGMAIGLLVGLLQALTQIQEQTIAFVPKIVGMVMVLSFALPWLITRMMEYSSDVIGGISGNL
jgi:flagellar biosynthetic protein FliQ